MRQQFDLQGNSPLSIPLREALIKRLGRGEQAILLLNRRGYARRRIHRTTGEPISCPRCTVALIPHHSNSKLTCHYCDYSQPAQFETESEYIDTGWAVERLELYLSSIFPDCGVTRMDRDNTRRKNAAEKLLADFQKGKTQILLGTQLVAKGHDFKNVNLVGILDADIGLGFPDFRAHERAFQLITQVAGRAGRHSDSSEVYLQTYNPLNPAIQMSLTQDFVSFYRKEMEIRRELQYPPLKKIFKVELEGESEELVQLELDRLEKRLRALSKTEGMEIMGSGFAPIKRINLKTRAQIFGKSGSYQELHKALHQVFHQETQVKNKDVQIHIDIDPQSVI